MQVPGNNHSGDERAEEDRPNEADRAKARFLIITVARIFGVIMVLMGIAVMQGMIDLPDMAAYVLIGLGLIEAFVMPTVLARQWSSRNMRPPLD